MKNRFFFTLLSFFFASSMAFAQCPVMEGCHEVDLNFPISGNGPNISSLPDWTYSHGSPSIGSSGFWLWSYNNRGEGINYSGYNFVAGQTYKICFEATTQTHDGSAPNPNATFNVVATNGPVNGFNTTSSSSPIPAIPVGSDQIVNANWAGTFPNPGTGIYTYTFTASSNFNNLWFFPSSPTLPQVEIRISSLVICLYEPCDASFTVCLNDIGGGQSTIQATLNDPSQTVVDMTVYENGVHIYSGLPISLIGNVGSTYTICMTVFNKNTGEECKQCYSFCLPESKYTNEKSNTGNLINSVQTTDKSSEMAEELKERPLQGLDLTISPNPSNGIFEISTSAADIKMASVKVFDLNSREVYSNALSGTKNSTSLNLKDQPVGVYIVKVQYTDGSVSQQKVVLEK